MRSRGYHLPYLHPPLPLFAIRGDALSSGKSEEVGVIGAKGGFELPVVRR